jgi:hypothetical protein
MRNENVDVPHKLTCHHSESKNTPKVSKTRTVIKNLNLISTSDEDHEQKNDPRIRKHGVNSSNMARTAVAYFSIVTKAKNQYRTRRLKSSPPARAVQNN